MDRLDFKTVTILGYNMSGSGGMVGVQGTAEGKPFKRAELDSLLDLALVSTNELRDIQRLALGA